MTLLTCVWILCYFLMLDSFCWLFHLCLYFFCIYSNLFEDFLSSVRAVVLSIFFVLFFVHSLVLKDFPLLDSAAKGGYAVFWRIISLQVFVQIALFVVLAHFSLHKGLPYLLVGTVLSLVLATSMVYSPALLPKLLTLPSKEELGEGFALILSIVLAWSFMKIAK